MPAEVDTRRGNIIWKGDSGSPQGNLSISPMWRAGGHSSIFTLATALTAHTLCNLASYNSVAIDLVNEVAPGAGANVSAKAILIYRNAADLKVYRFIYPAPIAADIEDVGYGKRIKPASVATIVALLSSGFGLTFEPLYGVYTEVR